MIFEDIKNAHGEHLAEILRQSLSKEDFDNLSLEDMIPHFEAEAATSHENFIRCLNKPPALNWPGEDLSDYLNTLRHRWKHAEELVRMVAEVLESSEENLLCA